MNYGTRIHILPFKIRRIVLMQTLKSLATFFCVSPLAIAARILQTASIVSFFARFADMAPSMRPALEECLEFCIALHHSRLGARLFATSKSMWFTCDVWCGGCPKNANATNLCTFRVSTTSPSARWTCRYPALSGADLRILPRRSRWPYRFFTRTSRLLTRPCELTSYFFSNPAIGSHFSKAGALQW